MQLLVTVLLVCLVPTLSADRIYVDGDVIIGALFPAHRKDGPEECGSIWEEYGIQRIEAFLFILQQINEDKTLLPKVKLGCDIRDSCWYPPKALRETKAFIRSSFFSSQELICDGLNYTKPIAGVIGPGSSSLTEDVQNMLAQFQIPEIGYSATSTTLSDTKLYPYFLRVVAPDSEQAKALVEFIYASGWRYVSALYSEGAYGLKGINHFKDEADKKGVCVGAEYMMETAADNLDDAIQLLVDNKAASVIVCFCHGEHTRLLIVALQKRNLHHQFTVVGSDGWNTRSDVVEGIEDAARGSFSITLKSDPYPSFEDHYLSLKPATNSNNPWFNELWQHKFNCSFNAAAGSRLCTGKEDLSFNFNLDGKIGFVADALYLAAHGLHDMIRDHCPDETLCSALMPLDGEQYLTYLKEVNFTTFSNKQLYFDENGNPPYNYQIMNFQQQVNGTYEYVQVAAFERGSLIMENSTIQWKGATGQPPTSICSEECTKGYAKIFAEGSACCWRCEKCEAEEFLNSSELCEKCDQGWRPNTNLTGCSSIEVDYLKWHEVNFVLPVACAVIGITLAIGTLCIAARHNDTPIMKASSRELSYLILTGILLAYLSTIAFVLKPTTVTCYITRILPGFSFSMIYGAVLTKTNRIARILARGKKKILPKKMHCMKTWSLVSITVLLIAVELSIIISMLVWDPAAAEVTYPTFNTAELSCKVSTYGILGPFGFVFFLISICTFYAVNARNVPANFNEAKFIGFSMYVTCVIWIAFIPLYFATEFKILTFTLCISISATVSLIFLFWPKTYIIVWHPERNTRREFTTTKEIRCHVGKTFNSSKSPSSKYSYTMMTSESKHSCNKTDDAGTLASFGETIVRANKQPRNGKTSHHCKPKATRAVGCQTDLELSCSLSQRMWEISSEESCFSHSCLNHLGGSGEEAAENKHHSSRSLCTNCGHIVLYLTNGIPSQREPSTSCFHRRCASLKNPCSAPKSRLSKQRSCDDELIRRNVRFEYESEVDAMLDSIELPIKAIADAKAEEKGDLNSKNGDKSLPNGKLESSAAHLAPGGNVRASTSATFHKSAKETVRFAGVDDLDTANSRGPSLAHSTGLDVKENPPASLHQKFKVSYRKLYPSGNSPVCNENDDYILMEEVRKEITTHDSNPLSGKSVVDHPTNFPLRNGNGKQMASSNSSIDEILSAQSRGVSESATDDDE